MADSRSPLRWGAEHLPGVRFFLIVLLAAWLGMTLGVWWVATNSFRALSLKQNPSLSVVFEGVPAPRRAQALRHAAGEVNRRLFRGWNRVQLVLALLVLALAAGGREAPLPARRAVLLGAGGVLLVVVAAHWLWVGPRIEALGRALDYADRTRQAAAAARFGLFHGGYVISDMAKAALLVVCLGLAGGRGRRES